MKQEPLMLVGSGSDPARPAAADVPGSRTPRRDRTRRKRHLPPFEWAYWALLAGLVVLVNSVHVLDADEGMILDGAWNLLHHRALYVDSFQYVSPGAFYALYWLFAVFGPSYWVAKAFGVVVVLLTAVALYGLGSALGPRNWGRYAGPLLYCLASAAWPAFTHNGLSALFSAWALLFFVRGQFSGSLVATAASGALAGIGILFLQHKGVLMAAVLATVLTIDGIRGRVPWRRLGVFLVAAALPLVVLLRWPLGLLYEETIRFPAARYLGVNAVSLTPAFLALAWTAALCLALGAARRRPGVAVVCITQVALLAAAFQRTDLAHTLVVLFPSAGLLPAAVAALGEERRRAARYLSVAAFSLAFVLSASVFGARLLFQWPPFRDPLAASPVLAYVRDHCPSLYAGPFAPGLYYEARRLNPTSYAVLVTGFNTGAQFEHARGQLASARPACAVMLYPIAAQYGHFRRNPVDDFIASNYDLVMDGDATVFQLRAAPR